MAVPALSGGIKGATGSQEAVASEVAAEHIFLAGLPFLLRVPLLLWRFPPGKLPRGTLGDHLPLPQSFWKGELQAALLDTQREVCAGQGHRLGYFGHCPASARSQPPPGPAPKAWEAAWAPISCLGKINQLTHPPPKTLPWRGLRVQGRVAPFGLQSIGALNKCHGGDLLKIKKEFYFIF